MTTNEDSAILDWIDKHHAEIDNDGPGFVVYTHVEGNTLGYDTSFGAHKTIRQAARAAMKRNP